MSSSISLTASVRQSITALTSSSKLLETATNRISSGLKVSSAIDNPTSYFASQAYTSRADALTARLDGMSEAVQTISAADNGITSISSYLEQMDGIISDAMSTTDSDERRELGKQYNELITQITSVAQDSGYAGVNLLSGSDSMTVQFSEKSGQSTLKLTGISIDSASAVDDNGELDAAALSGSAIVTDSSGATSYATTQYALALADASGGVKGLMSAGTSGDAWEIDWGSDDYMTSLADLSDQLESLQSTLKTQSSQYAVDLSTITTRQDFTSSLAEILSTGAGNLVNADLNEEAANVTSLTTAVSLATQALSIASEQGQNALTLIASA
jgi:flagellin-like hook-associated protein FlgL